MCSLKKCEVVMQASHVESLSSSLISWISEVKEIWSYVSCLLLSGGLLLHTWGSAGTFSVLWNCESSDNLDRQVRTTKGVCTRCYVRCKDGVNGNCWCRVNWGLKEKCCFMVGTRLARSYACPMTNNNMKSFSNPFKMNKHLDIYIRECLRRTYAWIW